MLQLKKKKENCLFETDVSISDYLNLFEKDKHHHEICQVKIKGAVSRNSDKLGNYKMPVKLRET